MYVLDSYTPPGVYVGRWSGPTSGVPQQLCGQLGEVPPVTLRPCCRPLHRAPPHGHPMLSQCMPISGKISPSWPCGAILTSTCVPPTSPSFNSLAACCRYSNHAPLSFPAVRRRCAMWSRHCKRTVACMTQRMQLGPMPAWVWRDAGCVLLCSFQRNDAGGFMSDIETSERHPDCFEDIGIGSHALYQASGVCFACYGN